MKNSIERLRKVHETRQTKEELKVFADKSEKDRLEADWKHFVSNVLYPAFAKVKSEVFGDKYVPLTERIDPGFKIKTNLNTEFWFWIEFQGRFPTARAGRKHVTLAGLIGVSTPRLNSKENFKLADVTEEDVLGAIAYAYEHYEHQLDH